MHGKKIEPIFHLFFLRQFCTSFVTARHTHIVFVTLGHSTWHLIVIQGSVQLNEKSITKKDFFLFRDKEFSQYSTKWFASFGKYSFGFQMLTLGCNC